MTRDDIVAEARSWVNVRYRKHGRSRTGIDCAGLIVLVGQKFNVPHIDEPNYSDWPDPQRRILSLFDHYLDQAPPVPLPASVGVFAEARLPGHTGIFSWLYGRLHLIHARVDVRKVIEQEYRLDRPYREMRLIRVYTFPGMEA